jgi:hypothetical protein
MQVVTRKKTRRVSRPVSARANRLGLGIARLFSRPVMGIVQKDYLVLLRDLRNVAGLITPVILGVMYTFSLLRSGGEPPAGRGEAPTWFMDSFRMLLAYGNILMALFVGWMVLSRLAGMAFSQEGRNYWLLKVALIFRPLAWDCCSCSLSLLFGGFRPASSFTAWSPCFCARPGWQGYYYPSARWAPTSPGMIRAR